MSLGAQSYASQGIEQALAAKWDTEANGEVLADFLPPLSFTQATNWVINAGTTYTQIDTNDVPQSGSPLLLTNYVTVAYIDSLTNGPYLREVKSTGECHGGFRSPENFLPTPSLPCYVPLTNENFPNHT